MPEKLAPVATIVAAVVSCLWFYIQLRQWQQHGDDYVPIVGNLIVTAVLWIALGVATLLLTKERKKLRDRLRADTADAAKYTVLWLLADWANTLAGALEEIWHHWDNNGKKLVHPLAVHAIPDRIEDWHVRELLEFRIQYRHLIDQGVEVHVIDNWSTDGSDGIAQRFPLAGFERFPVEGGCGMYRWRALLHRVEVLANSSKAAWCVLHDADEIRRSPRSGESLMDAFARMDREGYSAADHRVFWFQPIDELYAGDPEQYFRHYSDDGVDNRLPHIKAWKNLGRVSLARTGGHQAEFRVGEFTRKSSY